MRLQFLNCDIVKIPDHDGVLDNDVALWEIVLDTYGKTLRDTRFHLEVSNYYSQECRAWNMFVKVDIGSRSRFSFVGMRKHFPTPNIYIRVTFATWPVGFLGCLCLLHYDVRHQHLEPRRPA